MKDRVLHTPNSNQSSSKTLGGRRRGLGWRELTAEGSLLAAFPVTWIGRPLFLKGNSWHPYHGICHTATFWICHWNCAGLISHSSRLAYCLIFHHQSGTPWSKPSGSLLPTETQNLLITTHHLPSACLIIWQAIWLAQPIFHPTWDSSSYFTTKVLFFKTSSNATFLFCLCFYSSPHYILPRVTR